MPDHDITELLFYLSSNDFKTKVDAIQALGEKSSIEAYEALKLLLKKNDAALKPYIKKALNSIENILKQNNLDIYNKISISEPRNEKKIDTLNYDVFIKYINDADIKNRISVISACTRIGRDERIANILIERLAIEEHPFVTASILINLGRTGGEECIDIIASFLSHSDARIRANAVEGLDCLQSLKTLEYILKAASDTDARTAANAAKALLAVNADYVEHLLKTMLESKDTKRKEAAEFVIARTGFKFKNYNNKNIPDTIIKTELNSDTITKNNKNNKIHYENNILIEPETGLEKKIKKEIKYEEKNITSPKKYFLASLIIIIILITAYFFINLTQHTTKQINKPDDGDKTVYNSYEIEFNLKLDSIIAEIEDYLKQNKPINILPAILQLKKFKSDHYLIKIYEAEVKILEKKYREALSALKQAGPATRETVRFNYLSALCYYSMDNLDEAETFCKRAAGCKKKDDRYFELAENLNDDIIKTRNALISRAKTDAEHFFKTFYEILNEEGPRSLKQYFLTKKFYESFETRWRDLLLDVKQWKIDYDITNITFNTAGSSVRIINVKILEKWQYQNFGGICGITYNYNDYYLTQTPPDYAFDTDSAALNVIIKDYGNEIFDIDRPKPYELKYKNELTFIKSAALHNSNFSESTALLKKLTEGPKLFIPAVIELLSSNETPDVKELERLHSLITKLSLNSDEINFFSGGLNLKSTILNYIANRFLDAGNIASYKKILDEIITENPLYANAHLENAIYSRNNKEPEKCLTAIKKALEIEPDFPALDSSFWPEQYNANFHFLKSAEEKIDQSLINGIEKLIKKDPWYWRSFYNAGRLLLILDSPQNALIFFENALKLSPKNCSVLCKLIYCYYNTGDIKKARNLMDTAQKLEPFNFQVKRTARTLFK